MCVVAGTTHFRIQRGTQRGHGASSTSRICHEAFGQMHHELVAAVCDTLAQACGHVHDPPNAELTMDSFIHRMHAHCMIGEFFDYIGARLHFSYYLLSFPFQFDMHEQTHVPP